MKTKIGSFKMLILASMTIFVGFPAIAAQGNVSKWLQRTKDRRGENIRSDVEWRTISSNRPPGLSWIAADDFKSNGKPIFTVRWWGSYFIPSHQPRLDPETKKYVPTIEDGFILTFFNDELVDQPGSNLGTYIAPINKVRIKPTDEFGWDAHKIWQYEVNLKDTHLVHPSDLSKPKAFLEEAGETYWLSIAAENGHEIIKEGDDWIFKDTEDDIITEHFWGWHTSIDKRLNDAQMGKLSMLNDDWLYNDWETLFVRHDDKNMAFELLTKSPEKHQKTIDRKQNHQGNGKTENRSEINYNSLENRISFGNATIDTVFLNNDIPSFDDPILNGKIIIDDTVIIGPDPVSNGWFFENTSYQIIVDGATILTADLVNPFLFNQETVVPSEIHGLSEDLIFDSEFQALMENIVINNTINSPYLDDLQENVNDGKQRAIAIFSNILLETNNLTTSGTTQAIIWDDGIKQDVPEPMSTLGLLALGTIGTASTIKRKLKTSQK